MYGERGIGLNKERQKLAVELMVLIVLATAVGVGVFFMLNQRIQHVLNTELLDWKSMLKREEKLVTSIQEYIDEKSLALSDVKELKEWSNRQSETYITIYHDGKAIYSTNSQLEVQLMDGDLEGVEMSATSYPVRFVDGKAYMSPFLTFNRYYEMVGLGAAMVGFFTFLGIILFFIQKKLAYIAQMERELAILGGGDLTYPLSIEGNDELTSLAEEVERMRIALLDRQETERRALEANRDLVTAMSHDLRTPLTVLTGYLEILNLDKRLAPDQKQYIESASQKAVHIKKLSDKLFEHFLVFQKYEDIVEWESVNAVEFWAHFVEESLFDLESRGFHVRRELEEIMGTLTIDVELMRRVFNNLISNVEKYADPEREILVSTVRIGGTLEITMKNGCLEEVALVESSGLGLATCEKIIALHNGTIFWEKAEAFKVVIALPITDE